MTTNAPTDRQIGALQQEVADLRQRITELEQQVSARDRRLAEMATQHQRDAEALRASEARLRMVIEQSTMPTFIHRHGQFLYANPATTAMFGYYPEELQTKRVWDFIHPDSRAMIQQRAAARQQGEDILQTYESKMLHKDGSTRWINIHAHRIEFEGEPAIFVTLFDVTDYKRLEADLRASEARLRTVIDNSMVATLIHRQGQFLYANPTTEALFGYSQQELLTMHIWDVIHPDWREMVRQRTAERHQGANPPDTYELQIVPRDGSVRWINLHAHLIEFEGDEAILSSFFDVTEYKQMQAALQASEARLRTLIDSSAVATWVQREWRLLYANRAFEELSGYSEDELLGTHVWEVVHPDFRAAVQEQAGISLADVPSDQPIFARYEIKIVRKDGTERWIDVHAGVIEFDGQTSVLGTCLDITERKQLEQERIGFQEALIHAQKTTLRELSTPLIPISNQVVVMPLIGHIDEGRAQQVLDELLQGVATHRARVAILDITGVPLVDAAVALALVQAAQAVRLLGTRVILTGMRPNVAQSLVALDSSLAGITTYGSLQDGIAHAVGSLRAS